jgi:hypothetical protein
VYFPSLGWYKRDPRADPPIRRKVGAALAFRRSTLGRKTDMTR